MQALGDVGFSFAAGPSAYWVGAAMQTVDYIDAEDTSKTAEATESSAANTAHLARLLADAPYSPAG